MLSSAGRRSGAGFGRLNRAEPHPVLEEPAPRRQEFQPKHAAHPAVPDQADLEVGEQDGHLLPLALQRALGREDLEQRHDQSRASRPPSGLQSGLSRGTALPRPHIPRLQERNIRRGFFEWDQYQAVLRHLADELCPLITFAYITGWRVRSEVQPLQRPQVDFEAGTVCLEPGTTKNQEGRTFYMTPELRGLLVAQWERTRDLQRRTGRIIPWVFHRKRPPIGEFKRAHAAALSALVETTNAYRFYFGVYVRSVGRLTPVYMATIDPFRRLIVYPSLLRSVRTTWDHTFGTA